LTSPLPTITSPVIIDATTQPGSEGPVVELSGANAGAGAIGLYIKAGNSTVRGFVINGFGGDGIRLENGGGNTVDTNYVGTNVSASQPQANSGNGIHIIDSPSNTISNNVVAGNIGEGVRIDGSPSAGNQIQANRFYGDTGDGFFGNNNSNIYVRNAPRNVISGNDVENANGFAGIAICGSGNSCPSQSAVRAPASFSYSIPSLRNSESTGTFASR